MLGFLIIGAIVEVFEIDAVNFGGLSTLAAEEVADAREVERDDEAAPRLDLGLGVVLQPLLAIELGVA